MYFIQIYFKDLSIRYVVDFKHCEKNVVFFLLETLFGANDTNYTQLELQEIKIHSNLWTKEIDNGKLIIPHAPYVLTTNNMRNL
jgi:hypothetical protein